jgi:hypothetical protein
MKFQHFSFGKIQIDYIEYGYDIVFRTASPSQVFMGRTPRVTLHRKSPEGGLQHLYLIGVAVDPADPDTVIVSATTILGPPIGRRSKRTSIGRLSSPDGSKQ